MKFQSFKVSKTFARGVPLPLPVLFNHGVRGKSRFNLWAAMRCGENLGSKAIASTQYPGVKIPTSGKVGQKWGTRAN